MSNKKITLVAVVFILGVLFTFLTSTASASSLKEVSEASYKLYKNGVSNCSGTFVKTGEEDLFLTAAHCLDPKAKELTYSIRKPEYDKDLNVISEEVVYLNPVKTLTKDDIALLKTVSVRYDFATADIAEDVSMTVGDYVMTSSYPLGREHTISEGVYTGLSRSLRDAHGFTSLFYKATAPVAPGSSGGGLYIRNGTEYYLVGTVTALTAGQSHMNFFTSHDTVKKVMKGFE